MDSRIRSIAFAIILLGLSSIVLLQSFHTSVASNGEGGAVDSTPVDEPSPLQNANSTASTQSAISNSTGGSTNTTATGQSISASSSSVANSTAVSTSASQSNSTSQSSTSSENQTTAISYIQYQMTSMNDELVAMSSSVSAINQQTGMNTLIAEAGLIIGILAVIAAIAIARRADALYRGTTQAPTAGSPPTK